MKKEDSLNFGPNIGNAFALKAKENNKEKAEVLGTVAKGASYNATSDDSDAGVSYQQAESVGNVAQEVINDVPKSLTASLTEDAKKISINGYDPDETYNHPEFKRVVERNKFDFNIVSGVQESSLLGVTGEERNETKQFANEVLFDRYNPEYAKSNPYISKYLTESKFKGTFVELLQNQHKEYVDFQTKKQADILARNPLDFEKIEREAKKWENQDYAAIENQDAVDFIYYQQDVMKAALNGGIAFGHDFADTLDYYTNDAKKNRNILSYIFFHNEVYNYAIQNLFVKPVKNAGMFGYKSKNAGNSLALKTVEEFSQAGTNRYSPPGVINTVFKVPVDFSKSYQKAKEEGKKELEAVGEGLLDALVEPVFDMLGGKVISKFANKKTLNTAYDFIKSSYKAYNRNPIAYSQINESLRVCLVNSFAKKAVEQSVYEMQIKVLDAQIASGIYENQQDIDSVIYIEPEGLLNVKVNATDKKALGIDMQEVMRAKFAGEMVEVPKSKYVSLVAKNSQLHSQVKDYIAFDDSYVTNKRLRFQEMLREYDGDILLSSDVYEQTADFKVKKENLYIYHSIKNSRNFRVPKRKKINVYGA